MNLERSAYGIMCKLADEGPQRLGALASAFGLDPSTITRQVQALEEIGLASRKHRPVRPPRLDPRPHRQRPHHPRPHPRRTGATRLQAALADWSEEDRAEFGRLLEQFNASVDTLLEDRGLSPRAQRGTCASDLRPRSRCHCR